MSNLQKKYDGLSRMIKTSKIMTVLGIVLMPFPFTTGMDLWAGGFAISLVGFFIMISGIVAWVILRNNRSVAKEMLDQTKVFAAWRDGENEIVLSERGIYFNDEIRQCDAYSDFFIGAELTPDNRLIITDFHKATYYARHKEVITIDIPENYLPQAQKAALYYNESKIARL